MNNSSQSAAEDSLVQFERLERQLNGSAAQQTPAAGQQQQQQRNVHHHPSIQELDDDSDQESLHLPAHEPFMRQGMGGNNGGGAEDDDDDLPVQLSYQQMLLNSDNNSPSIISNDGGGRGAIGGDGGDSNTSSIVDHRHTHSTPVTSSSLSSALSIASREAPKSTPRTTTTTTGSSGATIASLMAPLNVPDFKHVDFGGPPQQCLEAVTNRQKRSPLQQLNVPNFKHDDIHPPPAQQQQQKQRKTAFGGMAKARPMYHSTPHNKHTMLKPTTPNGHQISPIPEESDELDQLVSALVDNHKQQQKQKQGTAATTAYDQRAVKSLVTQLRDVIAQWDWAQARHRHVAKIYFERQNDELNVKWEQLNAEVAKFNETKADEWAQIAKVRTALRAEREKRLGKKEADRIIQLEKELADFKAKDARASRLASELRTQNRELQGVVRVREQSYTDNMMRLKRLESQLVSAEQENSRLRTRLKLIRQEPAATKVPQHPNHQQQQKKQQQPQQHQQQHRHHSEQQRGVTFSTAAPAVFPPSCSSSSTTTVSAGQQQQQHVRHQQEPTSNFHWDSNACGCVMATHGTPAENVQIDYLHDDRVYEVRMPRGHTMRYLLTGHLDLHWANGDRTLIRPDGERRELYSPEKPNFGIEIFLPSGVAYRLNAQSQWQRETISEQFVPDPTRMSERADGSFVKKLAGEPPSLQINSPDFQLRRFADTKAVKLSLERSAGIQLWLCTDNVLLVKHVSRQSGNTTNTNSSEDRTTTATPTNDGGGGGAETVGAANTSANTSSNSSAMTKKYLCFSLGRCRHINI
ncbi:hypothetical protein niasHS_000987 [Heterodera schachtii]|uniref:Uncharacterized protein n=1 Tax=Heterodera schachtii TaxID=97005 RepID=A0ABD2K7X3_HETSC